jgi:septal ring factor EnvC (AmiA/AmiB activator)
LKALDFSSGKWYTFHKRKNRLLYKKDSCRNFVLGIFKGKEKKELRQRLDAIEKPQLEKLRAAARDEKEKRNQDIDRQIAELKEDGKEFRTEYDGLKTRLNEINDELTKDR